MPAPDRSRVTFRLVPLPKGVKGSRAACFLGDEPAGTYAKSTNKTFLCTATVNVELPKGTPGAPVGPDHVHAGTLWTGKKNAAQAIAWTVRDGTATGSVLPAPGFASSFANGVSGLDVVGTGDRLGDEPSRALLWRRGAEPIALANPHDEEASTFGIAADGGHQGGYSGVTMSAACIWNGRTESFVLLHPKGVDASRVRGLSAAEQVGHFEKELGDPPRAALWRGSAESFVDLTPDGAPIATASACAAGFQTGWIEEKPRSQMCRAWLWAGSAADSLDLHTFVGGDWTSSTVHRAHVADDRLLLLGTVEKRQMTGGFNSVMAEQACWWEYLLA
jgi:hypothetical protein